MVRKRTKTFDLTRFAKQAKSGDRIVIEVKQLNGTQDREVSENEGILTIPII